VVHRTVAKDTGDLTASVDDVRRGESARVCDLRDRSAVIEESMESCVFVLPDDLTPVAYSIKNGTSGPGTSIVVNAPSLSSTRDRSRLSHGIARQYRCDD